MITCFQNSTIIEDKAIIDYLAIIPFQSINYYSPPINNGGLDRNPYKNRTYTEKFTITDKN